MRGTFQKARRGFTLIELLAVIVILGVLVAACAGAYAHFIEQARRKNAADVCDQIAAAWTTYHRDLGFWPDEVARSGVQEMDSEMCTILGKAGVLDVIYIDSSNSNDAADGLRRNRENVAELKYGLLDPIGQRLFDAGRRGSEVEEHLYQFVLDDDEDGFRGEEVARFGDAAAEGAPQVFFGEGEAAAADAVLQVEQAAHVVDDGGEGFLVAQFAGPVVDGDAAVVVAGFAHVHEDGAQGGVDAVADG